MAQDPPSPQPIAVTIGYRLFTCFAGLRAYVIFLATLVYLVCFVGNIGESVKTIDSGRVEPLGRVLLVDLLLIGLFAAQHSGMARPRFKTWWTTYVPPAYERSTYVLLASCTLLFVFWQWRPIPERVWEVEQPLGHLALTTLFWLGWVLVAFGLFRRGHFVRFGLRQDTRVRVDPQALSPCDETGLQAYVRHPVMLGLLLAFWATPRMTYGHLLFALGMTGYILVGIRLEERDALRSWGKPYEAYCERVPRLMPIPWRWRKATRPSGSPRGSKTS